MYISDAKFEEHCSNISRDFFDWVLYYFSGTTYDAITFLICIMQKTEISRKKIFQKRERHSSLLWKAFQISSNNFLLHTHFTHGGKRNVKSVFSERSPSREELCDSLFLYLTHFRSQRPRSFWWAPRTATSRKVQFPEHAQRIRFVFLANKIVRLNSEHAQSDWKSVNRGLPV